ncbi:hypothetical protein [Candidatus Nitrosocosmicus arcticus]|uniref:Uncharacterized protein n=1 Tax=Candidatus Nitrosocosmicus arcticus TaxID=2035267 RepID=A0A557SSJ2_9ARCH|nr:hypothetical protein [Candidatus Nitrosocosmicus arcticus]TVP39558.1 hypothetical protein NARC_140013 [Candidatus Nitrosocosmicus arcticus]
MDHSPENIVKSTYGLYFPGGAAVYKTFTFNSSDLPIGTGFKVDIDYGDDYNQDQFGINSREKRPELTQFIVQ